MSIKATFKEIINGNCVVFHRNIIDNHDILIEINISLNNLSNITISDEKDYINIAKFRHEHNNLCHLVNKLLNMYKFNTLRMFNIGIEALYNKNIVTEYFKKYEKCPFIDNIMDLIDILYHKSQANTDIEMFISYIFTGINEPEMSIEENTNIDGVVISIYNRINRISYQCIIQDEQNFLGFGSKLDNIYYSCSFDKLIEEIRKLNSRIVTIFDKIQKMVLKYIDHEKDSSFIGIYCLKDKIIYKERFEVNADYLYDKYTLKQPDRILFYDKIILNWNIYGMNNENYEIIDIKNFSIENLKINPCNIYFSGEKIDNSIEKYDIIDYITIIFCNKYRISGGFDNDWKHLYNISNINEFMKALYEYHNGKYDSIAEFVLSFEFSNNKIYNLLI